MHLEFLKFLLKDSNLYLAWAQCVELWDTLVASAQAAPHDRETCYTWWDTQREWRDELDL